MTKFDFDKLDANCNPLRLTRNCTLCGERETAREDLRPTQFRSGNGVIVPQHPVGPARALDWENTVHWVCPKCRSMSQCRWRSPSFSSNDNVAQFVCYAAQYVPDCRALTLSEPWAWLIEQGFKDVENRTTHFKFTGRMFVHSAKTISPKYKAISDMVKSHNGIEIPPVWWLERNRCGRVVAVMQVAEMKAHIDSPWKMKRQWAWPIEWCHSVNPTEVIRGAQGFWRVPQNLHVCCLPL